MSGFEPDDKGSNPFREAYFSVAQLAERRALIPKVSRSIRDRKTKRGDQVATVAGKIAPVTSRERPAHLGIEESGLSHAPWKGRHAGSNPASQTIS